MNQGLRTIFLLGLALTITGYPSVFADELDEGWKALRSGELENVEKLFKKCLSGKHDESESSALQRLALLYVRENLGPDKAIERLGEADEWQKKTLAIHLVEQFGETDERSAQLRKQFSLPEPKKTPEVTPTPTNSSAKSPKAVNPPKQETPKKLSMEEIERTATEHSKGNDLEKQLIRNKLLALHGYTIDYPKACTIPQFSGSRVDDTKVSKHGGISRIEISLACPQEYDKVIDFYRGYVKENFRQSNVPSGVLLQGGEAAPGKVSSTIQIQQYNGQLNGMFLFRPISPGKPVKTVVVIKNYKYDS